MITHVRFSMALGLSVAAAVATPLYLPEAQGFSWPLAALGGGTVGALAGWAFGHIVISDYWAMRMPRPKK